MITEKYGFTFLPLPGDSPIVRAYVLKHFMDFGYPLSTKPSAQFWAGCIKPSLRGEDRCCGVFGWRKHEETVEITDFYVFASRWGYLAAYAMMERIKAEADKSGKPVVTATPASNTKMIDAYKKFFGATDPVLVVYRYQPQVSQNESVPIYKVGEGI
jgi:hypothetical protein